MKLIWSAIRFIWLMLYASERKRWRHAKAYSMSWLYFAETRRR